MYKYVYKCVCVRVYLGLFLKYTFITVYPWSYSIRDYFVEIRVSAGKTSFKNYVRFFFFIFIIVRYYFFFLNIENT